MKKWLEILKEKTSGGPAADLDTKELKNTRLDLLEAMDGLLGDGDRQITDEEESAYKAAERRYTRLGIELESRQSDPDLSKPVRQPPAMNLSLGEGAQRQARQIGGVNLSYRQLWYGNENASIRDNIDIEKFFKNATEKRGTGSDFIPESYLADVVDQTMMLRGLLSYVRMLPVEAGSTLTVGAFDSGDRSGGKHYGGVATQWRAEGAAFSEIDPETRSITFTLHKNGQFLSVSREMLEGFPGNFAGIIAEKMTFALNAESESVILSGDGIGKPTGIFNSPATIKIPRNTADTIEYLDLAKMVSRLHPALHSGAVFIANQMALEKLLTMVDNAGNFIWLPNAAAGSASAIPNRLLGLPLLVSSECRSLGEEGDIVLANLSQYGWASRKGVIFESTASHRWLNDEFSYRVIYRNDGKSLLNEPLTVANGTDTLSAFVILE